MPKLRLPTQFGAFRLGDGRRFVTCVTHRQDLEHGSRSVASNPLGRLQFGTPDAAMPPVVFRSFGAGSTGSHHQPAGLRQHGRLKSIEVQQLTGLDLNLQKLAASFDFDFESKPATWLSQTSNAFDVNSIIHVRGQPDIDYSDCHSDFYRAAVATAETCIIASQGSLQYQPWGRLARPR